MKSSANRNIKYVRAISRVVLPKDVNMIKLVELCSNFINKITLNFVNIAFKEYNFTITVHCLNKESFLIKNILKFLITRGFYIKLLVETSL